MKEESNNNSEKKEEAPMTPPAQKDCPYLLRRGMSVLCIDSYEPSRRTDCNHCIEATCFGSRPAPSPDALEYLQKFCEQRGYDVEDNEGVTVEVLDKDEILAEIATLRQQQEPGP